MILHKSCPRCGGDIMVDRDLHGTFVKCIQCSRSRHVKARSPISDLTHRRYPRLPGEEKAGSIAV